MLVSTGQGVCFGRCKKVADEDLLKEARLAADFVALPGFGRGAGHNQIFGLTGQSFDDLSVAVSKVVGQHVSLTDPKLFVQTNSGGLELHADPVAVVSWQISGRKRWRLFDATQMPQDMRGLRTAQDNPVATELLTDFYRSGRFVRPMERLLEAGNFLVMPPFTLHETCALSNGLSISLTLNTIAAEGYL